MVSPIQHNVVGHAVNGSDGVLGCLCQVKVREVIECLFKFRLDIVACRYVIWMTESVNVWVERF